MLGKWLVIGGTVLISLMFSSAAQAEGNCPEGYYPIGGSLVRKLKIPANSFIPSPPNP